MIKNKTFWFRINLFLFFLFFFLLFFKSDGALHGNEVSGIFYALFYRLGWQYLPSIFLYGHEPARGLIELPFILLGPNEFVLRLPAIIMGLVSFWAMRKASLLLFKNNFITTAILILFSTSGATLLFRVTNGIAGFYLFTILSIYYFFRFLKNEKEKNLTLSLIFSLFASLFYLDSVFLLPGIVLVLLKKYRLKTLKKKIILRPFFIFFILSVLYLLLWSAIPLYAAQSGFINSSDLNHFGFFRILRRGGQGFDLDIFKSLRLLNFYNHSWSNIFILLLFCQTFFNKKGKNYFYILALPLLYFSFHQSPTVHLMHFYPLIILGTGWGLKKLTSVCKVQVLTLLVVIFSVFNLLFLNEFYSPLSSNLLTFKKGRYQKSSLLKAVGYIIRQNSECSEHISSNHDSFMTLFYTGLPDKKKAKNSPFLLLFNDQLESEENRRLKSQYPYQYQLADTYSNFVNIYSQKRLTVPTNNIEELREKFEQTYNRSHDLFPNIECKNFK